MEVKIIAVYLFVHCKVAYFYSVTAAKGRIVSLPYFVTIRRTHFPISCQMFSWIRSMKLKIHAMEFFDFIKDSVSQCGLFVPCSLTITSTWRPSLTAHCRVRRDSMHKTWTNRIVGRKITWKSAAYTTHYCLNKWWHKPTMYVCVTWP